MLKRVSIAHQVCRKDDVKHAEINSALAKCRGVANINNSFIKLDEVTGLVKLASSCRITSGSDCWPSAVNEFSQSTS